MKIPLDCCTSKLNLEGKTMSSLVSELIEEYVISAQEKLKDNSEIKDIMNMSSESFEEWDNEEDEIYNDL